MHLHHHAVRFLQPGEAEQLVIIFPESNLAAGLEVRASGTSPIPNRQDASTPPVAQPT